MHAESTANLLTIRDLFVCARNELAAAGISDPNIEAEVLVRHVLELDRSSYFARLTNGVSRAASEELQALLSSRTTGEPLAHLTGTREFYGLEFAVGPEVLIPRQETELLVDLALAHIAERRSKGLGPVATVADVGTGSGAVAISLAVRCPEVQVFATDISAPALEVARHNAATHGVSDRVHLLRSDLIDDVPAPLDLILSNPPYIPTDALGALLPEVRREPAIALDGGPDGLDPFRRLLGQSATRLNPTGVLMVELMPQQMSEAADLARKAFPRAQISCRDDLMGNPRALTLYLGE